MTDTALAPAPTYAALRERFAPLFAEIAAGSATRERDRILPFEEVRRLRELGFPALMVPVADGGDGVGLEDFFRLLIDLAAADASIAHLYRSHFLFLVSLAQAPEETRRRWYARAVAGDIVGNASSETDNTIGATGTKARETDAGWVVDGRKYYSTGTIYADWIMVTTTIEGRAGRQFSLVDARHPGVERIDDWNGFGQRLTGTGTTIFTGVPVDPADVFDRVDAAAEGPALAQLYLLAVHAGIARAAADDASTLVRGRTRVFNTGNGARFRDDPQILQIIGEVSSLAHAASAIVLDAARLFDRTFADDREQYLERELAVDRAHVVVPELTLQATQKIFDALGSSSLATDLALDRHWRNARTVATHNPRVFKARLVGDYEVNGTEPVGLWGIGAFDETKPAG